MAKPHIVTVNGTKYVMVISRPGRIIGFMRVQASSRKDVFHAKKDAHGNYVPDFGRPQLTLTELQGPGGQGVGIAGIGADGSPVDVMLGRWSDWMDKNYIQLVRAALSPMLRIHPLLMPLSSRRLPTASPPLTPGKAEQEAARARRPRRGRPGQPRP